jgi:peroxiredoxin
MNRLLFLGALALAGGSSPARPQESPGPLPGHSAHGEAFNEGPRQKAHLMEGMGKVRFEITTRNPEAQSFFTQGVGQLHGFYYLEAERTFRQVALLDPECAMAYWGMAMANINNEKRAKEFIALAEKKKTHAGPREALWINTLAGYYRLATGEKEKRARAYIKGLEEIVQEYPDDLEAKAFLVWALWYHKDKGLPLTSVMAVDSLMADVLRSEPLHPGIHHYRIHLWDESKPSRALESAGLYGPSQSGIAHAWHMPGHIYSKLHRYADAARQQEASARVDHAHMLQDRTQPYQIHNYAHNNQWCVTDLIYVGRAREAALISENLIDIPRHPTHNSVDASESCARLGRWRLIEALVRWELWEELVARAPTSLAPVASREDRIKLLRALGTAHLRLGQAAEGRSCQGELEAIVREESGRPLPEDPGKQEEALKAREHTLEPVRRALAELAAHQAAMEERWDAAVEQFKRAEDAPKEWLARAHLHAGHREEAERVAKSAVEASPGQLYPLVTYVQILTRLGQKEAATAAYKELEELAVYADPELPPLRRLESMTGRKLRPKAWPDQSERGPLLWKPPPAPSFSLADPQGTVFSIDPAPDKPTVVLFYLGLKCAHCAQQLGKFAEAARDFERAGIGLVAVSVESIQDLKKACEGETKAFHYPFPLLADPDLKVFKLYRCYDDFEKIPLHGTFLVDSGPAKVARIRWQEISYEPFMDAKFLLEECQRLLALVERP